MKPICRRDRSSIREEPRPPSRLLLPHQFARLDAFCYRASVLAIRGRGPDQGSGGSSRFGSWKLVGLFGFVPFTMVKAAPPPLSLSRMTFLRHRLQAE